MAPAITGQQVTHCCDDEGMLTICCARNFNILIDTTARWTVSGFDGCAKDPTIIISGLIEEGRTEKPQQHMHLKERPLCERHFESRTHCRHTSIHAVPHIHFTIIRRSDIALICAPK